MTEITRTINTLNQAHDEIERLRAELARVRADRNHLQAEIDKLANWFLMPNHSYLIKDGGVIDNAINLLDLRYCGIHDIDEFYKDEL